MFLALCTQELPSVAVAIRSYLAPAGLSFTEEVAIAKPVRQEGQEPVLAQCIYGSLSDYIDASASPGC
jgi:hypothetical protein